MPENKTPAIQPLDPFKPAQPRIPGVSDHSDHEQAPQHAAGTSEELAAPEIGALPDVQPEVTAENLKFVWVGITLVGALATIFFLYGHGQKAAPVNPAASVESAPTAAKQLAEKEPQTAESNNNWPVAPGTVATGAQLAKPWSAKQFYFRDQVTQRQTPAMVVRLPGGALWAFSMREPYGTCDLEYVTNLRRLQQDYDFTASHPMVADPCNKSLFDLTKYGNAPGGLVRGEVVQGPAFRPPVAIEVRSEKNQIIAVRTEQ
ncbi:MAG TPA: hypothetical protein VG322_12220 [Candidatus Acidoferrales bacterium]|jgi:hypothetical protein|nr:hypothetical protein [Candidatus Acidoferrales bacterium]